MANSYCVITYHLNGRRKSSKRLAPWASGIRAGREILLLFRSVGLCSTKRATVSIAVADNRVEYHDGETQRRDSPAHPSKATTDIGIGLSAAVTVEREEEYLRPRSDLTWH